jgi:hypothetical protein
MKTDPVTGGIIFTSNTDAGLDAENPIPGDAGKKPGKKGGAPPPVAGVGTVPAGTVAPLISE